MRVAKQARPARLGVALGIAGVRSDPVDAIADTRRPLEVGFLEHRFAVRSEPLLRRRLQERIQGEFLNGDRLFHAVDVEHIAVIVSYGEKILIERNRSRAVAGAAICCDLVRGLGGGQRRSHNRRERGNDQSVYRVVELAHASFSQTLAARPGRLYPHPATPPTRQCDRQTPIMRNAWQPSSVCPAQPVI
jgi:hypothetical protein